VLVAHDTREHGEGLAVALSAGASAAGARAELVGVWPTPALACELAANGGDAGVVVTASHNGAKDNGFKILVAEGRKPQPEQLRALELELNRGGGLTDAPLLDGVAPRVPAAWLDRLEEDARGLGNAWQERSIAIDLANGATTPFRHDIAEMFPAQCTLIGAGDGVINDGVGSESLDAVSRAVLEQGCAIGFAVDGDGDRLRVVDEKGRPVPGDAVTWLLCQHLGLRDLAVTIMSNGALEGHLPHVRIRRTPVGDQHLQAVMAEEGIELGAEESGHILFGGHPGGDGCLAALRVLGALGGHRGPVSHAFRGFQPHPRAQRKVKVGQKPPLHELEHLSSWHEEWVHRLGPNGRVLLRYSGTEPVLRILVEGSDENCVTETAGEIESRMRGVLT